MSNASFESHILFCWMPRPQPPTARLALHKHPPTSTTAASSRCRNIDGRDSADFCEQTARILKPQISGQSRCERNYPLIDPANSQEPFLASTGIIFITPKEATMSALARVVQRVSSSASSSACSSVLPASQLISGARRSYHQNIIDHYETPRNVGWS